VGAEIRGSNASVVNVAVIGLAMQMAISGLGIEAHWQIGSAGEGPIIAQPPSPRPPDWKVTGTEGAGARLREGPSLQAETKSTLDDGTVVDPVGGPVVNDGISWSQVRTKTGDLGWIADSLLQPPAGSGLAASPPAATQASTAAPSTASGSYRIGGTDGLGVNFREAPGTDAAIIGSLAEGAVVEALEETRTVGDLTWRKIRANGREGWVVTAALVATSPQQVQASTAAPAAPPSGNYVVGGTDGLGANFREAPGTDATILASLAEGTAIEPLAETQTVGDQTWRKVRANGREGWVVSGVVHTKESAAATSTSAP
jgi:SH3-like domain-containing protein